MIRKVSTKRAKERRLYRKLRAEYLSKNIYCAACQVRFFGRRSARATTIHHTRGTIGRLLNMTEFWIGVCMDCHMWIDRHPVQARNLGLTCQFGQYNTVPC